MDARVETGSCTAAPAPWIPEKGMGGEVELYVSYHDERAGRIVSGGVSLPRYVELWEARLLKFQRPPGLPKPEHLPTMAQVQAYLEEEACKHGNNGKKSWSPAADKMIEISRQGNLGVPEKPESREGYDPVEPEETLPPPEPPVPPEPSPPLSQKVVKRTSRAEKMTALFAAREEICARGQSVTGASLAKFATSKEGLLCGLIKKDSLEVFISSGLLLKEREDLGL